LRSFTDLDALIGLVPAQVVARLSAIDFGRGSEALYRDQMPGLLTELADRARVQSITASSAIEGVVVADAGRADERVLWAAEPAELDGVWRAISARDDKSHKLWTDDYLAAFAQASDATLITLNRKVPARYPSVRVELLLP
jgi:hypothetical protein